VKKYIVRDKDTMWSISKATGVRLNLLMAANPQIQDPHQIRPGSVIVVPELHKGNSHGALEPGVPGPSVKEQATVSPPTAPVQQHIPQQMTVPMPGKQAAPQSPTTTPTSPFFGFVWPHVVKSGESWEEISKQYQVPVTRLTKMNPAHAGASLKEGDILYIPGGQNTQTGQPEPVEPAYEYGPHTHHPYRKHLPSYSQAPLGYPAPFPGASARPPEIPPGMWAFVPATPTGYGQMRLPMYHPNQMSPYYPIPSSYYRDWDDSSSWASEWSSSTMQPVQRKESVSLSEEPVHWFGESRDNTSKA
jgi:LysM repeat protein